MNANLTTELIQVLLQSHPLNTFLWLQIFEYIMNMANFMQTF